MRQLSKEEMKKVMGGLEDPQTCTVTSNCGNGSVSCTGKVCERGTGWVKCDNVETDCF